MDLKDSVDSIASSNVLAESKDTDLQTIIDQMVEMNVSTCILLDEGKLSGIITERDLVHKVLKENKDVSMLTARDIMTKAPLLTIAPGETIGEVIKIMKGSHVKSVPIVVVGGDCTGLVTQTDIVRALG